MTRIVIALGGNALGDSPAEQIEKIAASAPPLVGLIAQGHEIIISHGNGPQVGMMSMAFEKAATIDPQISVFDLAECTAMSQGYIGYQLQQGLVREMRNQGMPWNAATVVTQVEVDPADPAFADPTKPIGAFVDQETAQKLMEQDPGLTYREDAGRGWRRVVASPKPVNIVEKDSILNLLDDEFVVIACGGGGIPVVKDGNGFKGVAAVIDKDLASSRLAQMVGAQQMFILTAVDQVSINWGKPNQVDLDVVDVQTMEQYLDQGHFAPGSMLPKVQAAIDFVRSGPGRESVICSLEGASAALQGGAGTRIVS